MKSKNKQDLAELLVPRIIKLACLKQMNVGDPLRETLFAQELGVSRPPVRRSFALMAELGLVEQLPFRGYFLTKDASAIETSNSPPSDSSEALYLRVVDDILRGEVQESFFEAELERRYDVTRRHLNKVLTRLAHEAMIDRRPGQGWKVNAFLKDADAHSQSYRFRQAIEPAALLEPGYQVDKQGFSQARRVQQALLDGEIFTLSPPQIFEIGAGFHELLVRCSGNMFFLEAIRRQNQLRRFISYRSSVELEWLIAQSQDHLHLLDLIEGGSIEDASALMHRHLDTTKVKVEVEKQS